MNDDTQVDRRVFSDDRLFTEIQSLEGRFDRHVEIYANNGKELKRLGDVIQTVQHHIERMLENSNSCGAQVSLMYAKYMDEIAVAKADAKRMKIVIRWGAFIAAMGVIVAFIKLVLLR